jgi:hypothetical protein
MCKIGKIFEKILLVEEVWLIFNPFQGNNSLTLILPSSYFCVISQIELKTLDDIKY